MEPDELVESQERCRCGSLSARCLRCYVRSCVPPRVDCGAHAVGPGETSGSGGRRFGTAGEHHHVHSGKACPACRLHTTVPAASSSSLALPLGSCLLRLNSSSCRALRKSRRQCFDPSHLPGIDTVCSSHLRQATTSLSVLLQARYQCTPADAVSRVRVPCRRRARWPTHGLSLSSEPRHLHGDTPRPPVRRFRTSCRTSWST